MKVNNNMVAVIDFGSQYTQLIARRIRELNVFSEIYPHTVTKNDLEGNNIKAIVLSGGPSSVYDENSPMLDDSILEMNCPILGICYGLQLLIQKYHGEVISSGQGEYGFEKIEVENFECILKDFSQNSQVWMSHGDKVENISENWNILAVSSNNGAMPCGACRQVIWDLCGNIPIYICDKNNVLKKIDSSELLPDAFDNSFLK